MISKKPNGTKVGDWSKQSASEFTVRGKAATVRQDPADSYKVPNKKKK